MGAKFRQLNRQDRVFLRVMLEKKYPKAKIAKILGVDRSTIYRELKRNSRIHYYSKQKYYCSMTAQNWANVRRKRGVKLAKDKQLRKYVFSKLKAGWSPWQIEGRLRLENNGVSVISHATIYSYYGIRNKCYTFLRRKHFWRAKKGVRKSRFADAIPMMEINERAVFGHWECDLMMFKCSTKINLITIRERKTRFMIAIKNSSKHADVTAINIISTLTKIKNHVSSITFDQGSEFLRYSAVKDCIQADIYYCDPGSPYQKGSVENGNGVIRCIYPRDSQITDINQKQINKTVTEINRRPLKCLGYRTPKEAFERESHAFTPL